MPVREGRQAEIRADAVVGQGFHQRQRDAGGDRRARQRQRHLAHAPAQCRRRAGAPLPSAARRVRPARRASAGRRTGTGTARTGTTAPHRLRTSGHSAPLAPARHAQRGLQRAAELQGVGARHRPARRPAWPAAAASAHSKTRRSGKSNSVTSAAVAPPSSATPTATASGQQQRFAARSPAARCRLVAQRGQRRGIQRQPGAQHAQHRQGQQQAGKGQQARHGGRASAGIRQAPAAVRARLTGSAIGANANDSHLDRAVLS